MSSLKAGSWALFWEHILPRLILKIVFTVTQQKKINWKRLIYKQFVQVSGLCDQQLLSYLPKRCTHLCRASYGDATLVYIWSSLFPQKLFLFTRELAYMRINISSDTWSGYTAENQAERLFLTTAFLFSCHALWKLASSNCCIFEMKQYATGMETGTKIYFSFTFNLV